MPDYKQLSKEELIHQLELKEDLLRRDENKATRLAHDLQVHQIELEIQNRELRDKQQELEAARDMYANLYDFAPVGYLTLDNRGVIHGCNLTATSLMQESRGELLGKPLNVFLKKDTEGNNTGRRTDFFNALSAVSETGKPRSVELQLQNKDNNIYIQLLMVVPGNENSDEILVAMQDISERIKQERELNKKMDVLDRMNKIMVDRELRMVELKGINKKLQLELDALKKG